MESLKAEVIRVHGCEEHIVMENNSYCVSLLKFTQPRDFVVCSTETKRNCSKQDITEIFACMTEFIKNNPEISPCYSLIDVTRTDAFTLQQLSAAADAFKNVKSFLETRLVGTVVKVSDDNYNDGFLSSAFKRLYTPVRPVKWYNEPGDGSGFITEWEEKMK
jgi:hypothetical protein